jgi:hypothetical protein
MAGKPKTCINRYLGGLGWGSKTSIGFGLDFLLWSRMSIKSDLIL